MKRIIIIRIGLLFLLLFAGISLSAVAQDEEKPEVNLNLRYFLQNNKLPYLTVETNTKVGRVFEPVKGMKVKVYIDEAEPGNLLADVVTDEKGKAVVTIPPSKKEVWKASNMHTFIGVAAETKKFAEITSEIEITKARLAIATDTADGVKSVKVLLEELNDEDTWTPVEEVDIRVGIQRLNTVLPVNPDGPYTTDEEGIALAEFTRDSLPGDEKGNLLLVARVDDNDTYGTMTLEATVPWGAVVKYPNTFSERSLFATRDKAPYWLLFLSGLIFFTVWGTIVYLVVLLIRIRNLGKKKFEAAPVESVDVALTPAVE
ncbi:MAG: hypothetical protein LPJ89_07435 [Hymenobacteraceae bacterium]|nr:hypothetical protein [Hymenobacteraceae bacterium]